MQIIGFKTFTEFESTDSQNTLETLPKRKTVSTPTGNYGMT